MQEKQKFEGRWKQAFKGAEMPVPEGIWSGIELGLADIEGERMKKRIVFYQRLAAGLVLLSLALGTMVWNGFQNSELISQEVASPSSQQSDSSVPPAQSTSTPPKMEEQASALLSEPTNSKSPDALPILPRYSIADFSRFCSFGYHG